FSLGCDVRPVTGSITAAEFVLSCQMRAARGTTFHEAIAPKVLEVSDLLCAVIPRWLSPLITDQPRLIMRAQGTEDAKTSISLESNAPRRRLIGSTGWSVHKGHRDVLALRDDPVQAVVQGGEVNVAHRNKNRA